MACADIGWLTREWSRRGGNLDAARLIRNRYVVQSMLVKRILKDLSLICAVLAFWATAVEAQIPSIQEQLALAEAKWSTNKPNSQYPSMSEYRLV